MLSDDTIRRIMESVGLSTGGGPFPIRNTERKFARACYVEGQRDAQERISGPNGYSEQSINAQAEIARLNERIAELEREVTEQARLLGISGSTEARLLARVAELERDARARQSEQATLAGILRDCDAVLSTIEPENTDEADRLGDLRRAIAYAICPYEDDNSLFDVTKHRRVTYVCPVCAASLERRE